MKSNQHLSDIFANFVATQEWEAIPQQVRSSAKLLMLDAIGNAYAATRFDFAHKGLAALQGLSSGDARVIGMPSRLALRDAILMNGMLVHGLDFDDTYLPGSAHLTASCVPVALGMASHLQSSGKAFLTALIIGLEISARLAGAGKGGFNKKGFHATNLVGTFGSTMICGRLMQLSLSQLTMAQGLALSMASGTLQPLQDDTWAKRMHPGWAGVSAVTAASLAEQGFTGPAEAYEGKFGLFSCFLGEHAASADLSLASTELAERWEFARSSLKLYPACHQLHAFMNAAIKLRNAHNIKIENIESIRALVAEVTIPLICEPAEQKINLSGSYPAQFSIYYGIACSLVRGQFGFEELDESSYTDPTLRALAKKVHYELDPNSGFPKTRSGEVIIRMKNGKQISQREEIGPDDPATEDQVVTKFISNTKTMLSPADTEAVRKTIMNIENLPDTRILTQMLCGD
jgi:2-methylcitrate dehydratase PrpD